MVLGGVEKQKKHHAAMWPKIRTCWWLRPLKETWGSWWCPRWGKWWMSEDLDPNKIEDPLLIFQTSTTRPWSPAGSCPSFHILVIHQTSLRIPWRIFGGFKKPLGVGRLVLVQNPRTRMVHKVMAGEWMDIPLFLQSYGRFWPTPTYQEFAGLGLA